VTISPTNPALLAADTTQQSSGNNSAIIGGVIGGVGGAILLGGLGVFFYKRHKANHDFNEPFSPYDDDGDMSQYGPVTQRPMGSVTQQESSDGGSYGQYQHSPPPLGNVVQQPSGPGGGGYGNNSPGFAQFNQPQAPPMGNVVQHLPPGGDLGQNYGNVVQHLPPGGDVGQNYGNVVQHLPPGGDPGQNYGQYQSQQVFLAPADYNRHSLSTGSQENDTYIDTTAQVSRGDSQNWGYGFGHYRGPSDASYDRGNVPNEAPVSPAPAAFDKPDLRD